MALELGKAEVLLEAENPRIVIFAVGDMVEKATSDSGTFLPAL